MAKNPPGGFVYRLRYCIQTTCTCNEEQLLHDHWATCGATDMACSEAAPKSSPGPLLQLAQKRTKFTDRFQLVVMRCVLFLHMYCSA